MFRFLFLLFILFFVNEIHAQDSVSVKKDTNFHSPKKAALFSTVLPGLGQGYNKKYWKIPVVYAALGVSTYFVIDNSKNYHRYRNEYLFRLDNPGMTSDTELEVYDDGQLRTIIDQYQRWRDISWITLGAFYVLNIVDATVDAYLWRFDVSDNLSFHLRPALTGTTSLHPGFRLSIKF
ncbi:MAG: DUF5683 domain-containing protein [Bacteroidota bacterium]